jgi:hypothetical protein
MKVFLKTLVQVRFRFSMGRDTSTIEDDIGGGAL